MKACTGSLKRRWLDIILCSIILLTAVLFAGSPECSAAVTLPASTAYVNSSEGAIIRAKASVNSKRITALADNTKLTVRTVIFTHKTKTAAKYRWYYVAAKGKTGYIRADLVDGFKYASATGKTTDGINYRVGPSTTMRKIGTININKTITVQLKAKKKGSSRLWYRIKVGKKSYYACADYIKLISSGVKKTTTATKQPTIPDNISDVAKALRKKATVGGNQRIVYTFDESNCSKKFAVIGFDGIFTPQGMAFDGEKYCIMFGTDDGQRLVTYSIAGERIDEIKFASNIGHPNGITWDPITGRYYIFKGNQYTIYTYNPENGKFGTAKTPYSSSGVGYDRIKKNICCSSQTGIRVYSADGKFTHKKLFDRCTTPGKHYIQDCCAHRGFVFHGVSGADKASMNYIDVYRVSDGKYLGTIKEDIGEIESFIVNNSGYLEMFINRPGNTDYVWKTPLKVSELG